MSIAAGYRTKAGFRCAHSDQSYTYPTTPTLANTDAQKITAYDLLPFLNESISEEKIFDDVKVMGGTAGITGSNIIGILGGGVLNCDGYFLGLGQLIACALGWEFDNYNGMSPAYTESIYADNDDGVKAGSTATKIYANTAGFFQAGSVDGSGEWLRTWAGNTAFQTQRIDSIGSDGGGSYAIVTPGFSTTPTTNDLFCVAKAFTHLYECAKTLDDETWSQGIFDFLRCRRGTLVFDKTVDLWEWRAVMVESMTISISSQGVKFSFEVVPFDLNRASAVNTSSSAWAYSASPTLITQEIMRFGNTTFRLDDFSTSVSLGDADKVPITSFEITIKNNLDDGIRDTRSGLYRAAPVRSGMRSVTGSFTLPKYESDTRIDKYDAGTILMGDVVITGSALGSGFTATNKFSIFLRSLKLRKPDVSISGPQRLQERWDFVCEQPNGDPSGMPAETTGSDNSEVMMEIVNNDPFNAFLDQNAEDS